jgi:hypothetical protein
VPRIFSVSFGPFTFEFSFEQPDEDEVVFTLESDTEVAEPFGFAPYWEEEGDDE